MAHGGEPVDLIHEWADEDEVILVDAVDSGAPPGTVHRIDAADPGVGAVPSHGSTHALGVAEAIALGRALGQLPARLTLFGIEGGRFNAGGNLSPEVELATQERRTRASRPSWPRSGSRPPQAAHDPPLVALDLFAPSLQIACKLLASPAPPVGVPVAVG